MKRFKNNLFEEIEENKISNEETNDGMHFVQSQKTSSHLTQDDYEDFMICNQTNETIDE